MDARAHTGCRRPRGSGALKWLVGLAFAAGSLVAAAAVVQLRARDPEARSAPAADAPAALPCPAADAAPGLAGPEAWAGPLTFALASGATLEVDGAAPGATLAPGRHVLVARGPGASPARVELAVEPFTPVLVEARRAEGAMTLLVLGASCTSCRSDADALDTQHRPGSPGSRAEVSRALAAGEVARASQAYRGIPPEERGTPEPVRLLAALHALAGDAEGALALLGMLPHEDPLAAALAAHRARAAEVPARQQATAVARWNALTDRYQRLSDAFAADAPAVVSALTSRFDGLSVRFHRAQVATDAAVDVETTLDEANATLTQFVLTLRALRAADCAWQRRVSAAL